MLTILLVDNDISSKSMMESILKELGHEIYVVSTIQEIEIIIRTTKIDLIISKIKLTDGNTINYFRNLNSKFPIIFITRLVNSSFIEKISKIPYSISFVLYPNVDVLTSAIETSLWMFDKKVTNKPNTITVSISYGKTVELPVSKILWVIVTGNYTTIKTVQRTFIQKTSFKKIKTFLDDTFVQIDKSCIINTTYITFYNQKNHMITIQNKEFQISPTHRSELKNRILEKGKFQF